MAIDVPTVLRTAVADRTKWAIKGAHELLVYEGEFGTTEKPVSVEAVATLAGSMLVSLAVAEASVIS